MTSKHTHTFAPCRSAFAALGILCTRVAASCAFTPISMKRGPWSSSTFGSLSVCSALVWLCVVYIVHTHNLIHVGVYKWQYLALVWYEAHTNRISLLVSISERYNTVRALWTLAKRQFSFTNVFVPFLQIFQFFRSLLTFIFLVRVCGDCSLINYSSISVCVCVFMNTNCVFEIGWISVNKIETNTKSDENIHRSLVR